MARLSFSEINEINEIKPIFCEFCTNHPCESGCDGVCPNSIHWQLATTKVSTKSRPNDTFWVCNDCANDTPDCWIR